MECSISAQSLRIFVKALTCLQKFGDDVCFNAMNGELKMSTVSATRSAFAMFALDKGFFQRYQVMMPVVGGSRHREQSVQIQFAAKALLAVLKPRTLSSSVESCSLTLEEEKEGSECRLIVKLYCHHGVVKTHRLNYTNASALFPLASRDQCTSTCIVSPAALQDWTEHFWTGRSIGIDEVTFWCSDSFCKLRNYENAEYDSTREKGKTKSMSTTLSVDLEDFEEYHVATEELITFSLKELKAIVAFADSASSQVDMAFSHGGEPVLFAVRTDSINADFVLATTADDPAQIKEEKDVKPAASGTRLTNGHVGKAPPPRTPSNVVERQDTPLFREATVTLADSQNDQSDQEFGDLGEVDDEALQRMEAQATQTTRRETWNLHAD